MSEKFPNGLPITLDTEATVEKTTYSTAEEMIQMMRDMKISEEKFPEILKEMEKQLEKPTN
jgi:hypothetical protein